MIEYSNAALIDLLRMNKVLGLGHSLRDMAAQRIKDQEAEIARLNEVIATYDGVIADATSLIRSATVRYVGDDL